MSEKAGEFYEHQRRYREALDSYRKGGVFKRAVDLARREFLGGVTRVDVEWDDHLMARLTPPSTTLARGASTSLRCDVICQSLLICLPPPPTSSLSHEEVI